LITEMALDPAIIDRIVTNVLEQIRTPMAVRAVSMPPSVTTMAPPVTPPASLKPAATEYGLTETIVTAAVLDQLALPVGMAIVIGPKSILTPSAHDWLRQRKVTWKRGRPDNGSVAATTTGTWRLLAATVTPTVRSLLDHVSRVHPDWRRDLVGKPVETVDAATRLISTAEASRLLIITHAAEMVAAMVNRNEKVRAAVISTAERLRTLAAEWDCNVVIVSPEGRSLMELRAIVQTCVTWN
jgi:hypothetical protein